jgi:hypothetical protein
VGRMPHTLQTILAIGPPVTLWIFIAVLASKGVQPVARACVAAMGPLLAAVALWCGASAGAAAITAALATVAAGGWWHNRLRALSAALPTCVPTHRRPGGPNDASRSPSHPRARP